MKIEVELSEEAVTLLPMVAKRLGVDTEKARDVFAFAIDKSLVQIMLAFLADMEKESIEQIAKGMDKP